MKPSRENPALSPLISDRDLGRVRKLIWSMIATIKSNMDRFDKNATRKTRESMEMYQEIDGYRLEFGIKSDRDIMINVDETGRKAGKVPYRFWDIIYKWSLDKGIDFPSDSERKSFSWFVANKIKNEGSAQFRIGRNPNIYSNLYHIYEKKISDGLASAMAKNLEVYAEDQLSKYKSTK